jgi:hypothetical protein
MINRLNFDLIKKVSAAGRLGPLADGGGAASGRLGAGQLPTKKVLWTIVAPFRTEFGPIDPRDDFRGDILPTFETISRRERSAIADQGVIVRQLAPK